MEKKHQNELLPSPLPQGQKLAFLSVLKNCRVRQENNRSPEELDPFLVASMFDFAADDVRRRIFWTLHPENEW